MRQFRMKYQLWSTNNSSKNESSDGGCTMLSKQNVCESTHNQVNYTLNDPVESQAFAFRDKTILNFGSKDTSPDRDDEWLELYRVQNENPETEPNNNSESDYEKLTEHFPDESVNESFSKQSHQSLILQTSLRTESDNEKEKEERMKTLCGSSFIHQSSTSLSDIKAMVHVTARSIDDLDQKMNTEWEVLESSLQLPSLDTLPMRRVEVSSRSSVLSISSFNESTEDENAAVDNRKVVYSEQLTENDNCFDIKSNAEENFFSFNELANKSNMSDQRTESGRRCSQRSPFQVSNRKMNPFYQHSSPLPYVHMPKKLPPESMAMNQQMYFNENQPLKQGSEVENNVISENVCVHALSIENNLNVNNITESDENRQSKGSDKLPPLPPRRRSRTVSNSEHSSYNWQRPFTPPPSYQRHELLFSKSETRETDDSQSEKTKHCFPYPSLVRFPPPRNKRHEVDSVTEEEVSVTMTKKSKSHEDVKDNNLASENANQPDAMRTEDIPETNTPEQRNAVDEEMVTHKKTKQQFNVERNPVTPKSNEKKTNLEVVDGDDSSTANSACDRSGFSCCTLL